MGSLATRGEHIIVGRHHGWVNAVALGELEEQPIALSGANENVRVWNLGSGAERGKALRGHTAPVRAVVFGKLHGEPIALSGSEDARYDSGG